MAQKIQIMLAGSSGSATAACIAEQLEGVERRFVDELRSSLPCVNDLVRHIERYRGKMLRPSLVLAAGMATAPEATDLGKDHQVVATVVELIHMATLIHDDVLDEAEVRRNGKTINHLQGNEAAVMLGDYVVSHAYHLCASLDRTDIARIIAAATNQICEGELHQLANRGNWELDEQTYYQIIRGKTACLCGACCRIGATLNDADSQTTEALYDYGERLGMAFQIVDDLLDLIGSQDTVGKTLGLDLAKGKLTLPLIHFLSEAAQDQADQLRRLLENTATTATLDRGAVKPVRDMVVAAGSVEHARQVARDLIDQACAALGPVPDSPAKSVLLDLAQALLTRQF